MTTIRPNVSAAAVMKLLTILMISVRRYVSYVIVTVAQTWIALEETAKRLHTGND